MSAAAQDNRSLAAVLFDMDGLLVDTEPLWFAAETVVVSGLGGVWGKEDQQALLGTNLDFAARYMVRHTGSRLPVDEVADRLQAAMTDQLTQGVRLRPGAESLVAALSDQAIPMALVTSSVRHHLGAVLPALPPDAFRVVVTADDVDRLKPHPEPYLRALDLLGVRADRSVALEDSPAGVLAAEAAGCVVAAVPSVVAIEPGDRRQVFGSLTEVDVPALTALVSRW